jgi:hypothetical protein
LSRESQDRGSDFAEIDQNELFHILCEASGIYVMGGQLHNIVKTFPDHASFNK